MAEEKQAKPEQQKEEAKEIKAEAKSEEKKETKAESKVDKKKEAPKKDYALVNGINLAISAKESIHICNMIRGRNIDTGIRMLEEVTKFKRVIKMNNREYPHKHGKGVMGGTYPINAIFEFIKLAKALKANALHHELEIEKYVIFCKADKASRPYRRGGARFKRANIMLRLEKKKTHLQNKPKAGKTQ